ncbi:MAG: glycosyltransferase [Deltaproteobacteria bacterium]|nr:glycosyltransferase [Deltaproteobacteria bacterium]
MRIVIDMQGAQSTGSRNRGIGRYSLSLALAMARHGGQHEVLLALNALFPDTIEPIRAAFYGVLPQANIRVWNTVSRVAGIDAGNDSRRRTAERVREAFLAGLRPDVVHVTSLFEGFGDDAVTGIGLLSHSIPTAVTLYDLIPYIHRKPYLEDPAMEAWYLGKIEHLRRADLWLAISESSRKEGISRLGLPEARSVNISTDAGPQFRPLGLSAEVEQRLRQKYGLHRPFVMYTGGTDHRKNIEGLIRAFARLPEGVRKAHQLAIVCFVQPESKHSLERLAMKQGLTREDMILTGFVPEDDLVALYNLCTLFVFPSWHEGFGLPALEAMRSGAPVVGANTSSLPEVIGWAEAMFDPHSDEAMASVMERALSDPLFRDRLIRNGQEQSAKFSWEESAGKALAAMERLIVERRALPEISNTKERRPRLAYVSPLPSERSGIADYSAELLPELARHYEIDVVVVQDSIADPWIKGHCPIRSAGWLMENAARYERVLYHFGNSQFHEHMFGLLKAVPGVVVLHDFFLSSIVAHRDADGANPQGWARELYASHGFPALRDRFHCKDTAEVVWKYPCSLSVIQDSLGVIVHSPNSLRLAQQWYGDDQADWAVIPLLRDPQLAEDKASARKALGFRTDDFLVCAFGLLGPTKLNHRLLETWLTSSLARSKSCHLIYVGENDPGEYGRDLLRAIRRAPESENIRITGWVDRKDFRRYLAAADLGVQLRTLSRGEMSAAVLDCMNYGLATIVNANGSIADHQDEAVWKLPDAFTDGELAHALETLRQKENLRLKMGKTAREIILRDHHPRVCAEQYRTAIERFYRTAGSGLPALPNAIAGIHNLKLSDADLAALAEAIAQNFPLRNRQRQLLVDISEYVQRDAGSGIQRVVRNVLWEWLNSPPAGCRVEPVYATVDREYRYARRFTLGFLNCPDHVLHDEPMEYAPGDIFFALDLEPQAQIVHRSFYRKLRSQGVQVIFAVYDLLCTQMPLCFAPDVREGLLRWLNVVAQSDGAICISKAVADDLASWVEKNGPDRQLPFTIDWFHLGADMENSLPSRGLPSSAPDVLEHLRNHNSFLMVGTLDPRKGHIQVVDAFERLWRSGQDANLVIIGKQGWMSEDLVGRLRAHPQLNKRLFWLEGASDEYLEKVYAAVTCLIAASFGEGFGLPLIEAAQHKLPVMARDIPVFREVAGDHAFYFQGSAPDALADNILAWLAHYKEGNHPKSDGMPWLSWRQSAEQLRDKILRDQRCGTYHDHRC